MEQKHEKGTLSAFMSYKNWHVIHVYVGHPSLIVKCSQCWCLMFLSGVFCFQFLVSSYDLLLLVHLFSK